VHTRRMDLADTKRVRKFHDDCLLAHGPARSVTDPSTVRAPGATGYLKAGPRSG